MKITTPSKHWLIIIGLALIKLTIHLITNTNYELHRDGLLYYSLGEHLDWGYVSVPPFIGLISKVSTFLFGDTTFALNFFPALAGSISVVIIAQMVREINGRLFAVIIAVVPFILSPAFLRSNTLFQPVSFNQFFWLLSGYFLLKLIKTHKSSYWIWIFIVWGVAFLNKYSITFFIISALAAMLISKHRTLMRSTYFFFGGVIAILIILPNLIWQHNHNWPVIHHMTELQKQQLVNVSPFWFLVDQFLMNLPGLIVWFTGFIVFLFFRQEKKYRFFGYLYLLTLLMLILLRGKSYYTLGLYPILFALGGYAVDTYFRRSFKYLTIILIVLLSLPLIPFSLPVISHERMAEYSESTASFTNRWEDGKVHLIPQDYADMTGWRELSSKVIDFYHSLAPREKKQTLLFADNYGQAGAILFYGQGHPVPDPICFSDNFILWAPDSVNKSPLLFIGHDPGEIRMLYDSIRVVDQVQNKYFRENGLKLFYCTHPRSFLSEAYKKRVRSLKSRYVN